MENKLNLVEILKNCPSGMELDCAIFDNVIFEKIDFSLNEYPIVVRRTETNTTIYLTEYGQYSVEEYYKCVIFPKGRTTWEGFVPPCKFKDGDVVVAENKANVPQQLFLLKCVKYHKDNNGYDGYCYFGWDFHDNRLFEEGNWGFNRLATEEEKQKLFDAIKANGYRWNAVTKTLEKLIEPKPKFKVGDRIRKKGENSTFTITDVNEAHYFCGKYVICDTCDNNWELVPNKFDINTLVPFESRVLVRDNDYDEWRGAFWGHLRQKADMKYDTLRGVYRQCIPYEGNEHLLGKTYDCDSFYKNWE